MRLMISVFAAFLSQAAFSATECTGTLSLDSGNHWSQVVQEKYIVEANYLFILSELVLRIEKPGQLDVAAEYDFCEITTLGQVSEYECSGPDDADPRQFPSSIHITDAKKPEGRQFTFYGENKFGEGKVVMKGNVSCQN